MLDELSRALAEIDRDKLREVGALLHASPQVIFVGNGGSAAIASHMAIDWMKNGKVRARAFNDAAALTCLSNDLGYDHVFSWQLEQWASISSAVVCISSSGRSPNILNAARTAKERGCTVVTLSGFSPENPLRKLGDANFYVASESYGVVECAHLAILHSMI